MAETVQHGGPKDWTPPTREEKVIFRKWPDGQIDALFPEIPYDDKGWSCMVYARVGQHAGANCARVIGETVPATPEEYQSLLRELGQIGYKRLRIVQRVNRSMLKKRQERARRDE